MELRKLKCVACDKEAITTAAHVPVCKQHHTDFAEEGRKYLPYLQRKVYLKLLSLYEHQKENEKWTTECK